MSMGANGILAYPPTIYFPNINFNNDFYAIPNNGQGITLNYANTHYLFSTGNASSSATTTFFSGSVGIGTPPSGVAGDLIALTIEANNISAYNNVQEGGINLSSKYQAIINSYVLNPSGSASFSSGTLTINLPTTYSTLTITSLTAPSITASTSIIYKGTEISSTFLPLTGGTLTGILTGTTINATTLQQGGTSVSTLISNATSSYLPLSGGTVTGTLIVNNSIGLLHTAANVLSLATIDSNLFGDNSYYNAAAGDTNIYSYWGVSINLNNGGNNPSGSATYARIANTSSFTINQKAVGGTATSGFTNLFTVLQNGNTGIGTTNPLQTLHTYGVSYLQAKQAGVPSTGALGTDGTAIIIYPGSSGSQSMALGFASYQLWYNVPSTNYHNFNVGGTSVATISSSGIGIGTTTSTYKLDVRGSTGTQSLAVVDATSYSSQYQLIMGAPTSTTAAFIQTIQQGVGYSQNLTLQASGGNVGIGMTNPTNALHLANNKTLRIEGGTGLNALSIGGSGIIYIDAPGVIGGRFTILENGNIGIGSTTPGNKLVLSGDYTYLDGLRLRGTDILNTIWNGNANMGITVNSGYTLNLGMNGGNGAIISITNTSTTITQPTTINSTLTASGTIKGNQYYCTMSSTAFGYYNVAGGTYGFFIEMNNWWYLGYSYLIVSASIIMGGSNTYCWNGRVLLSPSSAVSGYPTILTSGGVMNIITDYANPSSGPYYMNPQSGFDGSGNNYLYFSNTYLNAGVCYYKIYG